MNELLINDEIGYWGITAQYVIEKLSKMNGDITVKISSNGGDVFQGIEIHNALKDYNKGEVIVVITSIAASIASYIALAGDKIKAYDNATFMIHNAWTYAAGDHRDFRKTADIVEGLSSILNKKYVAKTSNSKEDIQSLMDEESFFYGEEILSNGFCDEIISTDEDTTKSEAIALAREGFVACAKNMAENFNKDEFVQCAAKLTKDGILALDNQEEVLEVVVVANNAEQEKRKRDLEILEMETK